MKSKHLLFYFVLPELLVLKYTSLRGSTVEKQVKLFASYWILSILCILLLLIPLALREGPTGQI